MKQQNRYEEYAYVLEYKLRGKSKRVRGREGFIIQAIGERYLTLLELLGMPNVNVEVGERVYIGREGRTKILSVLGKLKYNELSPSVNSVLPKVIESIIRNNEERFMKFINTTETLLGIIPGIGSVRAAKIMKEREVRPFKSYEDLYKRTGLKDAYKLIAKRVLQEISKEEEPIIINIVLLSEYNTIIRKIDVE
jgi:putative nucleotide binding protein